MTMQEARPYEFAYGVQDDGYGPNFSQNEKSDGNAVLGSYTVQLPDGRKQTVSHTYCVVLFLTTMVYSFWLLMEEGMLH